MKIFKLLTFSSLAALFLLSATAQATALLRITPEGVAVADQIVTDPVPISTDGFRLTYHGGGNDDILNPLILIFGTATGSSAPLLVADGDTNPATLTANVTLGGTNVFGGSWDAVTGNAGTYDSTASGSVYDYIGFSPQGNDSQNYSNWSAQNGDTSWDLWVYTIVFGPDDFSHGDWMEFSTTNLAANSFVIGYGCTGLDSSDVCDSQSSTPFTFAGYTTVPEPGVVALLAIGLIGMVGASRRMKA